MNIDKYFDDYDFKSLIEQVLKENNISGFDSTHSRHLQELRMITEKLRKSYKKKNYFQDLPTLNDDFSSYVILTNTPFVEEAKQEKFKMFLNKKVTTNFKDKIKAFIFPYTDKDKDQLKDAALLFLQFETNEEAKLAAQALNGAQIDKTHKANAVTYLDYDKILSMEDKHTKPKYISFLEKIMWEENNLTEMFFLKSKEDISVGKVHYLKKEMKINYKIKNENINSIKWSPQGKYLIVNEMSNIKLYNGENNTPDYDIDVHAKDYCISNNEKYLISFIGYSENTKNEKENPNSTLKENVFIRDIDHNELIRGIAIGKDENFKNFKWSNDSGYFGRIKNDILIVYESPKMQMILDPEVKKRHPIMDNVKSFQWFPSSNTIIAISERKNGAKLAETKLNFIQIPSRNQYPQASLMDLEIVSFEWHKSNSILAVLCKTVGKPKWSVRLFQFTKDSLIYRSGHSELPEGSAEHRYYDMTIKWLNDDIFVVPKYKENNLDTIAVFPYKFDKKSVKIVPWSQDKCLKSLKHSHFLPSSNGTHFLLACLDSNNSNSYGKVDLYAIFDNQINFCKNMEFGQGVEKIEWDQGGRLFVVEMTKKKDNDGLRIVDCQGNTVLDYKDKNLTGTSWRPRHIPILDKNEEYEKISSNMTQVKKQYDEEDAEFLSEIDKIKRLEEKRRREKFMKVAERRRKVWNEEEKKRQELDKEEKKIENIHDANEKKVEHEFWIEEIMKTEEFLQEAGSF